MPLAGLELLVVVLLFIATSHWLGSITTFGSSLLAFPILVWLLDIKDVRTILLLTGTVQSYQVLAYVHRDVNWRLLGRMVFFAGLGLPIGILAVHELPQKVLMVLLGAVLLASGASQWPRRTVLDQSSRWPTALLDSLLVFGGVIQGAFVSGGPALVLYTQHRAPQKDAFRSTMAAFWTMVNSVLIVLLVVDHPPMAPIWPIVALAIPLVLVTSHFGNLMARRMTQNAFTRLVATLMIAAGAMSIGHAAKA